MSLVDNDPAAVDPPDGDLTYENNSNNPEPAAASAVASKLTNEFLERVVTVPTAMEGDD